MVACPPGEAKASGVRPSALGRSNVNIQIPALVHLVHTRPYTQAGVNLQGSLFYRGIEPYGLCVAVEAGKAADTRYAKRKSPRH